MVFVLIDENGITYCDSIPPEVRSLFEQMGVSVVTLVKEGLENYPGSVDCLDKNTLGID